MSTLSPLILILAALPGLLVCWAVYRADRYERESVLPVVCCYVLGVAITFPAISAEKVLIPMVGEIEKDPILTGLLAFGAIAPVEEFMKWFALLFGAMIWRFFNEPFDGIVYSVMISMGFASVENFYYLDIFGPETALLRAFTAIPAHLVFAIPMGYYAGLAKFDPRARTHLMMRGLLVAILLHGAYDFLVLQNWTKWLSTLGAIAVYMCLYYFGALFREHLQRSPFRPRESEVGI
ncbi:MAG: PrsW family intramembrane metalloprotease [Chitinophagales bacterium]|nr:PrsW family intramembrane metalloprotease [Chitinophagales bacterium]